MNKFFKMNSLFTKIILAVLSFAVIICIFIPYMRIPATDAIQDIDVASKIIERKIGSDQLTFSITEFTHSTSPVFELYKDKELTETVNKSAIKLPNNENTYYFATYAYGYDKYNKNDGLKSNLLAVYKIVFKKDVKNNALVNINTKIAKNEAEGIDGVIEVTVPKATTFDLVKIIDSKNAWLKQKSAKPQFIPMSDKKTEDELKNMAIPVGGGEVFYAAICFASEATQMYCPLDVYTIYVDRDAYKETLPVVGEIGGGIMSKEVNGTMEFYEKDLFMFSFMILAAIATIFALTIANKFRIIELIVAGVLGLGLVIIPVIDIIFYSQHRFEFEAGCFVLIVLGVLIVLWSIFDYIRCTDEYKKEMIHLYGEDFFSKERKIRMAEEKKIKDAEFKIQRKADKEALKAAKAEEAAKLAAYKAEQKLKKKK